MTDRNLDIARAAYAAYAVGDIEAAAKAFAPDVTIHGPEASGKFEVAEWSDRGGFAGYVGQIAENWRLVAYELKSLEADGDWVVAFLHIAAVNWQTQGKFDGTVVGVMRFRDGVVIDYHEHVDTDALKAAARR